MDKNRSKKYFIYRAISIILIVSVMIFNKNVFAAKGNPNNVTTTGENFIYNDPAYMNYYAPQSFRMPYTRIPGISICRPG